MAEMTKESAYGLSIIMRAAAAATSWIMAMVNDSDVAFGDRRLTFRASWDFGSVEQADAVMLRMEKQPPPKGRSINCSFMQLASVVSISVVTATAEEACRPL